MPINTTKPAVNNCMQQEKQQVNNTILAPIQQFFVDCIQFFIV
jgi:hypothetical protein